MADSIENSKEKSKWGGSRPGAGRPQGGMNSSTKERLAIKQAFQDRVARNADKLFNSQFNLASGEQYLMWKHKIGSGTKERTIVEVVTDLDVIKSYLDETLESDTDEYYYISTKPANGNAIDSMLDRAFGKADATLDVTTNGENMGITISADQAEQLIRARANRTNS